MKNLLYKEFKLVVHPFCIFMVLFFPLLALIPNYPKFVSFFYIFTCYPIIFIGSNKGANNNDVFYSLTLPVKREDIVLARFVLLSILHIIFAFFTSIYFALSPYVSINIPTEELVDIGFGANAILVSTGFSFIALAILDAIFLPLFYKTARNITASCIFGGIAFGLVLSLLNGAVPYIPVIGEFFNNGDIFVQITTFVVCLILYFAIRFFAYKICCKYFKRVDF